MPINLSLSHRAGKALCFVASCGVNLGCDLELVEARDDSFVTNFFTANEQRLLDRSPVSERANWATLVWSAKESALKALHVGLRVDTAFVEVSPNESSYLTEEGRWSGLSVRCLDGRILRGWWRCANGMVRTLVFNSMQ